MELAFIPLRGGEKIPLRVRRWSEKFFIECEAGAQLLDHLKQDRKNDPEQVESPAFFIRGVCEPGKGGYFDLFDQFGRLSDREVFISPEQLEERLFNILIWRVPEN